MKFEGCLYDITAECIAAPEASSNDTVSAEYTIKLNGGHAIFGGHFPGRPVLPGVCIMQITGELLNRMARREFRPRKFTNVKFLAPVEPSEGLAITVDLAYDPASGRLKATWTTGETPATKISAIYDV